MALFPKTPGVYIEEIQRLPSSVVAVPTAVPAFIGYTQQVVVDGNTVTSFPTKPIRVESMIEYQAIFGGANPETFNVTLTGADVNIALADTTGGGKDFRLFYNLQMYFANGGGPCYIISVGTYSATITDASLLTGAIPQAEKEDEITLLLAPDAMSSAIDNIERSVLYNAMLAHCAKMQDRFAILDVEVITTGSNTIANDAKQFRENAVGPNNLSYAAAYYPSFNPLFPFSYVDSDISIIATDTLLPLSVQAFNSQKLDKLLGVNSSGVVTFTATTLTGTLKIDTTTYTMSALTSTTLAGLASEFAGIINADTTVNGLVKAVATGATVKITSLIPGAAGNYPFVATLPVGFSIAPTTTLGGAIVANVTLYNSIKERLNAVTMTLYPSATMAGVYCSVDAARGVWKAPANVGVNLVGKLGRNIKDADQSDLNVDATSGKSIDVIRNFAGRGKIVWGARTLDGNSNEWRYINVRRTFIMIEESCKKATMFSVFEPNDKNTWLRVQGMISNFLTTMWRDGALAGAKPEQAFFVKVGLGETMTAQDILEGRMIVQIGLAVVRPAEFIILQFEHKLQVS
jgi:phage tail sheath protein FI